MKKCPYCAEEIQDEAIRCKHCQTDFSLATSNGAVNIPNEGHESVKSNKKQIICVLFIIIALGAVYSIISYTVQCKSIISSIIQHHGYNEKNYKYKIPYSVILNNKEHYSIYVTYDDNTFESNFYTSWFVDVKKLNNAWIAFEDKYDSADFKIRLKFARQAVETGACIDLEKVRDVLAKSYEERIEANRAMADDFIINVFNKGCDIEKAKRTFNIRYPKYKL